MIHLGEKHLFYNICGKKGHLILSCLFEVYFKYNPIFASYDTNSWTISCKINDSLKDIVPSHEGGLSWNNYMIYNQSNSDHFNKKFKTNI